MVREAKRAEMKRIIAEQKRKALAARRQRMRENLEASGGMGFELCVDDKQTQALEARRRALLEKQAARDRGEVSSESGSEYEYVTDSDAVSSEEEDIDEDIRPYK